MTQTVKREGNTGKKNTKTFFPTSEKTTSLYSINLMKAKVIRHRTHLELDQAKDLMTAINQNQLHDLLPFLKIGIKGAKKSYRLCIDCPADSHPRIVNKIQDSLGLSFTWEEYDEKTPIEEATGMTPEFKKYAREVMGIKD